MALPQDSLAALVAKEEIRQLAMLYCRGVDRNDTALLKTLYTTDAIHDHGLYYNGPVDGFIVFLLMSLPHIHISRHFIGNHLISVNGDAADGEVYAIAWNLIPDGDDGFLHDIQAVRYIDNYVQEHGKWCFAKRVVKFDMKITRPAADHGERLGFGKDPSNGELLSRLFAGRTNF